MRQSADAKAEIMLTFVITLRLLERIDREMLIPAVPSRLEKCAGSINKIMQPLRDLDAQMGLLD